MDGENYWIEDSKDESPFSLKKKRNVKIKKLEFVGWGSAQLIEFLVSIGTDMSRTYSQHDVAAIVTNYVNSNNLLNPQKKKRVMCDDRLHALFGKKSIPRIKIHDLLEVHFKENHDESDDETSEGSDEDKTLTASKRRKTEITKVSPKKKVPVVSKSCLAAVIAENIKLVYLKRSLIMDLLKSPESSDDKILGCFVRVKSDPNDCFQKNSHQLQQVEGVRKEPATSSAAFEILLRLSNTMKDIPISSLSDDLFSEEELDNLRERINDGLLKKPTVLELELKAQVVHKDITKHWIERELALLQNRIDHANEKGWRKQLFEYMEKRKLLQTQKEQDRLLSTLPTVVAEELETEVKTVDAREVNEEEVAEERRSGDSPKSNFNGGTDKSGAGDTMLSSNRVLANGGTCNADQKEKPIDMIMEQTNTAVSVKTVSSRELDVFANGDTFNADQKAMAGQRKRGRGRPQKVPIMTVGSTVSTRGSGNERTPQGAGQQRRGRGRPRKVHILTVGSSVSTKGSSNERTPQGAGQQKRGRGQPRKVPIMTLGNLVSTRGSDSERIPQGEAGSGEGRGNERIPQGAGQRRRGRGRPRKVPIMTVGSSVSTVGSDDERTPQGAGQRRRGRGRPRKVPIMTVGCSVNTRGSGNERTPQGEAELAETINPQRVPEVIVPEPSGRKFEKKIMYESALQYCGKCKQLGHYCV